MSLNINLKIDGRNLTRFLCVVSVLSVVLASLEKSPKIITQEGNVILEAGINKNITIRLNGHSRLIVNDLDLLQLLLGERKFIANSTSPLPIDGIRLRALQNDVMTLKTRIYGRAGLNARIRRLMNRNQTSNPTNILRRTQRRITTLEGRVQSLVRTLRLDNCKSNPCENGGSCIDLYDGFMCKCTKGFEGLTCSTDVNECALFAGTDLGCQNGAQCINQFGSYSCICNPGWQGIHCNQRKTDCLHSSNLELCGHGTCVNANDNFGYRCICEQGWKSNGLTPSCSVDIDECKEYTSSCATKCINLPGGFMCAPCEAGYTGNGLACRDIDECSTNNGGCSVLPFVPCINTYGSFHCSECPIGWIGDGRVCTRNAAQSCSRNNICHPHALCQELSGTIVCSCPHGQIGNGVGPNGCSSTGRNICSSNPCLNGGTCMDTGNGTRTCLCPIGFRLPNCVRNFNPCASSPCRNGGTCRPQGNSFTCSCISGYAGRLCDSPRSRCGQFINREQGNLKYPITDLYNHNAQCSWVIRTDDAKVLNITFSQFDIEDAIECRFDWLQMHDGPTAASQLIGRFCGATAPLGGNIITTTNKVYLWFKSDNSTSKAGFNMSWTSIDPVCGGIVEFDSHATIASPGSPGNYPRNRDCRWHLKAPNTKRIKLVFFNLQIEKHSSCNHDYLEITDLVSDSRLEIFCNSSNPAPFTVPSNEIMLHFHSDNEGADLGFQIHASTVERVPGCGGTYTERNGEITSPTGFEGSMSCEYTVRYPKGIRLQLHVSEFKMGDEDCIEIYNVNSGVKDITGSRWCGKMNVPDFRSTSNEAQINYYSKGGTFKMSYRTICEYLFEESSGVITSPNYPAPYPADETCSYEIIGEPTQVVSLEFVDMQLETYEGINGCWFDFITITDGNNKTAAGPFCGEKLPPKIISDSSFLKLTFQTDRGNSGRGFKANYTLINTGNNCGGVMRKTTGEIRLPMDESSIEYQHDLKCVWTIIAPVGYGIQLFWTSFRLEETTDCLYDFIEIFDTDKISSDDTSARRYCGFTAPPAILSATNLMTIRFTSDSSDAESGFVAKYSFVDVSTLCGGDIFSSTGKIRSPNWPNEYSPDLNCSWTITVQNGHQLELIVTSMDLEESENCTNDWLEIRNGGFKSSPLLGKYCGQTIPNRIPSFTNQMHIHFSTNSQVSKSGFQIEWQKVSSGCGGVLSSDHGSVSSPYYPQYYSNDAQCEWRISVNKGSTISIKFDDISLESLLTCTFDFVEVYDGSLATAARRIGRYCENPDNKPLTVVTTGSDAVIRFQSDGSNTERGFYLSYTSNCNQNLTAIHGAIESPNFGDNNPSEINCTWQIQAPKGNRILLHFAIVGQKELNTEGNYVYFKDNGTVIRIAEPTQYESHSDSVQVLLNSSLTYFRMEYAVRGCVGSFHRASGEFTSPEYPNAYPNNMGCLWQIETDFNKAIVLDFFNVDIKQSTNCTEDGIKVWNTMQRSHLIGTFCGKQDNITVTSSSHTMVVEFYSSSHANGRGFTAKYNTIEAKCGGKFKFNRGQIHSPNYPNNYDSDLHCEWEIEVSEHSTMNITIEELDLEASYRCFMDSLKIYDGTDTEKEWNKFCGDQIPTVNVYRTSSNVAKLVFDTDSDTVSKGFKVSFRENCGKRIILSSDNSTGRIRFTGSDQPECMWVIAADDPSKHVTLTITQIQTTLFLTNDDCEAMLIYEGDLADTTAIRPKKRICSQHPPASTSLSHAFTIKLDPFLINEFEAMYSLMDNNCGGRYSALRGTFASPSYPLSYPVNIECIWEIVATDGNSLALTIQNMDIDKTEGCNADYLEVREGGSSGRLVGVFCGDDVPEVLVVKKSMWIKFNSDNDFVRRGFIAEYGYAINTELNGTSGVIESPKYPSMFSSQIEHSWRIKVARGNLIMLTFEFFLSLYEQNMKFYNGYNDEAEPIEYTGSNIIRSDTNVLFIKSSMGVFKFRWYMVSKQFMANNMTSDEKSPDCLNELLSIGNSTLTFKSPGYPEGYDSNLNCSWIISPIDPAMHAVVSFQRIDLEDDKTCASDRVIIYSSTDLTNWKQLDKKCQVKSDTDLRISGDRFLKVEFLSDFGVNKTGFAATASTMCGSTLTDPSGVIKASEYNKVGYGLIMVCVWKIQVKSGRRVKISFIESQLKSATDTDESCITYVLLKNGISEDSPNLGNGKYCNNNLTNIPITSSNEAYVKIAFQRYQSSGRISFKYEEVMNDCIHFINLVEGQSSIIINSENYPNIPNPHTRCVWNIKAPVNRLISVDFVEPMDLKQSVMCDSEYVELHDGGTELSPVIGRFCGRSVPNTQYSSGNLLRFAYFTDISEPHIGFRANVSIGMCGGTYRLANGTISSPTHLIKPIKSNFSCDYIISLPVTNVVNLTVFQANLPWSTDNCSEVNHLRITPIYEDENATVEPIIICGDNNRATYFLETNKVHISYRILTADISSDIFELKYFSVGYECGRTIEAESGILKSPAFIYPIRYPTRCFWKIRVPKGRRIKLEFMEFNIAETLTNPINGNRFRIPSRLLLANDFTIKSVIARISNNPPAVIYSSDNLMSLLSFEGPSIGKAGFKLRFSSDEKSTYCNENFDKVQGDVHFRSMANTSIFCRYNINVRQNETIALTVNNINTTEKMFEDFYYCDHNGPLLIRDLSQNLRTHWFCTNRNETTVRLPYPVTLEIMSNSINRLTSVDLKFARHNCGGVFVIGNQFHIREPSTLTPNYGPMDCAWKVLPNPGDLEHFEITLSVDFKLKCDEQYLTLYAGMTVDSPRLGRFCNQETIGNLIASNALLIEYHTSDYELVSSFNLTATVGTGCGGELTYPFRIIDFRKQYQNNVECIWTIRASKEYHLGLKFSGRFFIESSANCSKDYILIEEEVGFDEWHEIKRICGREPPALLNTTTNVMRFIFRSDDSGTGDGFTANFERNCGGVYHASGDIQILSSPNYPSPYDNNLTCNYTIIPSIPNRSVLLQIMDFLLEDSPTANCEFDNLTVYQEYKDPVVLCGSNRQMEEFRSIQPITLVFRSDYTYSKKGFRIQFSDEMCGGKITSSTAIATPKQISDKMYPSNTVCAWNITAPEGSKIIIKFEKFDFEGSMSCSYDYVQIFTGKVATDVQQLAKLCGNLTGRIPPFTIKSNFGIIKSVSDYNDPSVGFSALVHITKDCDKDIELKDVNDRYLLRDFAEGYDNDLNCGFLFKATPGHQVIFEFTSFHVEQSSDCTSDYVQILDGGGPFADEIGKYCGHVVPNAVMSSRATLFVRFVSDSSETSTGFEATVKMKPMICGARELQVKANESTIITSGEGATYQANLNCFWHLRSDYNIHLNFEKLDIDGPNENGTCNTDYLKIFNKMPYSVVENTLGSDIVFNGDAHHPFQSIYDTSESEHVFCGQGAPEGYYTNNQDVYIKFFTDSTIEKSGFKIIATAATGCLKNFTSTQGRILMGTDANCNIYINAPKNYSISIYFNYLYFFYGDTDDCNSNYIEIFNENTTSAQSIKKFCGTVDPANSIFTDSNKLRLYFSHSGIFNNYDITFLASDKGAGCGGDFYNSAGIFTSPFYPENVRNNSDCRWNIRVPNNLVVYLEFRVFNLGSKVTCHSNYLQILEKEPGSSQEELMRQFCGEDLPTVYTGRRNLLSIRFKKTVNFDGIGWVIRFSGVHPQFSVA